MHLSFVSQAVVRGLASGYRSAMSIDIAIVADDLTGALDTSTPFVLTGRRVAAAIRPNALAEAAESGAPVIVINTASRALPPADAARRVGEVAAGLATLQPRIVFKKIDSRLKGNVRAEVEALAEGLGFDRIVVAPAIPDQDRPTIGGAVTGRGLDTPLPIAPLFAGCHMPVVVADASSDADLDGIVASENWSRTLAVGARGLGAAFARRYGPLVARPAPPLARTLIGIGSRDPITERQIGMLLQANPDLAVIDAPLGETDALARGLPALIRATGTFAGPDATISARFAEAVARNVEALAPEALLLSGGDTALAVLDKLGVRVVFPQGEAAPGLPWFTVETASGQTIRCIVKSGGFGSEDVLARLVPAAAAA